MGNKLDITAAAAAAASLDGALMLYVDGQRELELVSVETRAESSERFRFDAV